MTLNKITFALFLLFFSIRSLAADQEGRDLSDVLEEYAQDQEDGRILEDLVNMASLIGRARIDKYLPTGKDYQLMSEAFCQYGVSVAFEKVLSDSIGKINSIEIKTELSEVELELKKVHKTQSPYQEKWPANVESCQKINEKYNALLSGVLEKLNKIDRTYRGKIPPKKNRMIDFIKSSIDTKQFDEEVANAVRDLFARKSQLEQNLVSLKFEQDQFLHQLEERKKKEMANMKVEEERLYRLQQERKKIDKQLDSLKGLRTLTQQEVDIIVRQKGEREEQKAAQEAAIEADLQQKKENVEKKIAELAASLVKKQQETEADLKQRREEVERQMAELASQLLQKRQEVDGFKVSFKEVLENSFPNLAEKRIEFVGGNDQEQTYINIKKHLERQVRILEEHFARSREAGLMGAEKEVQHRFILSFVALKGISGVFSKGIEGSIFITAEIIYRNIKESISLEAVTIDLEETGELTKKNTPFLNQLKGLIYRKIPQAKKTLYEKAMSPNNQQMLYSLGHSCIGPALAPCLNYEGDIYPSAPFAYPQISQGFPNGETADEPGTHPEGQPHIDADKGKSESLMSGVF